MPPVSPRNEIEKVPRIVPSRLWSDGIATPAMFVDQVPDPFGTFGHHAFQVLSGGEGLGRQFHRFDVWKEFDKVPVRVVKADDKKSPTARFITGRNALCDQHFKDLLLRVVHAKGDMILDWDAADGGS